MELSINQIRKRREKEEKVFIFTKYKYIMGNAPSCNQLIMSPNAACNIGDCAQTITGQQANSASPSDIWVVRMQPNTNYENIRITTPVNLKIFISPNSPTIPSIIDPGVFLIRPTDELRYEREIYEYVVNSMLSNMINPFFVTYYGGANDCTFDQLFNNLSKSTLNEQQRILALLRNTFFMSNDMPNRPSITDDRELNPRRLLINGVSSAILAELFNVRNNISYGLMATSRSVGTALGYWMQQRIVDGNFTIDGWVCILQVVSALAALEGYQCAHNDLHHGNIFVEDTGCRYRLVYDEQQQNVTTTIRCNMKACLYDWDRSYVADLGNNPYLAAVDLCTQHAECNEYIPQRDMTKFFLHLMDYEGIDDNTKQFIINLLCSGNISKVNKDNFVDNVVNNGGQPGPAGMGFLVNSNTETTMTRREFEGIRTPKRVLSILVNFLGALPTSGVTPLMQYTPSNVTVADIDNTYIFTIDRINMFKRTFMTNYELERRRARGEVVQRMEL